MAERRIQHSVGRWMVEAYIDATCLMIGVNWAIWERPALYIHVGPLIVGVWFAALTGEAANG
jgi:hypothetical protein